MDPGQPLEKEKVESEHNKLYEISEKQENRVRLLETSMMQLVFAYVFFQGVIFVSIFPHPNVSCDYWWIPFSLSCLIFVIFAIPFKCYVRNWELTKHYHEMNFLQQDLLHRTIIISSSLETNMHDHPQTLQVQSPVQSPAKRPAQSTAERPVEPPAEWPAQSPAERPEQSPAERPAQSLESPLQSEEILKSDTARGNRRKAFTYMVSLALIAYTILILKACQSIPCHRDATP